MLLSNYCKFVAFSILLWTRTVHSKVSFTIYSAVTFERLAKIFQSLKMIHCSYSRSYFNLLLIYGIAWTHVNTNLHKYKNSCDSSKDRLDTKILSRFSKLPDKYLSLVLFLSPKNLTSLKLYTQVLLVGAFAVVWMVAAMRFSRNKSRINHFSKSFQVVYVKKCWFLETRFVRGSSIVAVFCLVTQRSLRLPDLSKKIEGPLLARYKLININFFKDRSFQQCLVLDILTNPVRVTITKKVTFCGNIHCQIRCLHTTLWRLNLLLS